MSKNFWNEDRLKELKEHKDNDWKDLEKIFGKSKKAIMSAMRRHNIKRTKKSISVALNEEEIDFTDVDPNILKERKWDDPVVMQIDRKKWDKRPVRVGLISGVGYFDPGFRAGLLVNAFELMCRKAVHFIVLNGHLVDGKSLKDKIRESTRGFKKEKKAAIVQRILDEAVKALAALIPKIQKPGENDFVRLYIITSPKQDGEYGEEIAHKLQELRPEDIRVYNAGGDKLEAKEVDQVIWFLNSMKTRMPSKYHSTVAEKEIDEKRRQTSQEPPSLWAVGGKASAVHTPKGVRPEPYITIPALRRLEAVQAAENQVGVGILKFSDSKQYSYQVFSYRDLIAGERKLITGITTGAKQVHRAIVEAIKQSGPLTPGLLADKTGIPRTLIDKEIKFLVKEEASRRKTWPGLHYNPSSQRFDFHLDWIQERLSFPALSDKALQETLLLFGCMHAGYTTTDYEFVVKQFPEIILRHNVEYLCGLGDFIAGLHHDFLCSGEVFGQMNYTEQEELAADMLATIIYKVFSVRFKEKMSSVNPAKISTEELTALIKHSLITFLYIPGNHDLWQERDGHTPLIVFRHRLLENLIIHISKTLIDMHLPSVDLFRILSGKMTSFPDFHAKFILPSGLSLGMQHPHMGRGQTTTLRAQHYIGMDSCQIYGIANFHTGVVVHEWDSSLGQCVVVQAGTEVMYTRFERRKSKGSVDFGPILLRVRSQNKRIIMTETAFFNDTLFREPIKKSTDPDNLRKDLGILMPNK